MKNQALLFDKAPYRIGIMKSAIKKILHKRGLYYSLKYSRLFHLYQLLFKPAEIKQQRQEIAFYKSFLPGCKLIFDIGANNGHKTEAFLAIAEKVICCEPDSEGFTILKTRFRNKKKKVILENIALSDKEGSAEMHIQHPGSAFNTLSNKWMKLLEDDNKEKWNEKIKFTGTQTVQTTTLDQLIEKYGVPDYIKIDVEGFEQWVLNGLSRRVAYLSFETLLPDYVIEMQACLSHIENLDNLAAYNIAQHEKLVFPDFVKKDELKEWLNANSNAMSFEIVVKMST
jgi:FkbM family methyltransferase